MTALQAAVASMRASRLRAPAHGAIVVAVGDFPTSALNIDFDLIIDQFETELHDAVLDPWWSP